MYVPLPLAPSSHYHALKGVYRHGTRVNRFTVVRVLTEGIATTATSLGFDFIPNPSIVALPDHDPIPKSSLSMNNNSSFRSSHAHAHAQSPSTPALVPTTVNEQEVEDEDVDEDDDWEHISRAGEQERDQRRDDEGDEGDMIFLGELELEDRVVDTTKGKHVVVKGGKSYAAAAGSTVKA